MPKIERIIFSDVTDRDGLGLQIWKDNELILEIFRDDGKRIRTITTYLQNYSVEEFTEWLDFFNKEIPKEFMN